MKQANKQPKIKGIFKFSRIVLVKVLAEFSNPQLGQTFSKFET
jgi:hypothetical protein